MRTSKTTKNAYLEKLTEKIKMNSVDVGKDLDVMIINNKVLPSVVKSVTVDVVVRALATPTNETPMTQYSQSALGYSVSGTYLVPGGGIFIKNTELKILGLKNQRYGVIEFYDKWHNSNLD